MTGHTPGPWKFEVNPHCKTISLVGRGTVMDFVRWGMSHAAPRFVELPRKRFMVRADELTVVVPGREHHAHWFRHIKHPDAQLIEAAPDLLAVVQKLAEWNRKYPSSRIYSEAQIREIAAENDAINAAGLAAIAKATQP